MCVKGRKQLLSKIIGGDAGIAPQNLLSNYVLICGKYINNINIKYKNITVDKYVIMPNHIHLIIFIHGTSRTPSPTIHNLYNRLKTCNVKIFASIDYFTRYSSIKIYVTAYTAKHNLPFRNLKNAPYEIQSVLYYLF